MKENYHSQTADDLQTSEMKQAKKIGKWFGLGIVAALTNWSCLRASSGKSP